MQFFEEKDFSELKGYLVFLDIDGTLVPDDFYEISDEVKDAVGRLQNGNSVYLCTNSPNKNRNEKIALALKLPLIRDAKKPSIEILDRVVREDLKMPKAVIGDKVLTDGLFAKKIKAKFFMMKRKLGKEKPYIKLLNLIDDISLKIIEPWVTFS